MRSLEISEAFFERGHASPLYAGFALREGGREGGVQPTASFDHGPFRRGLEFGGVSVEGGGYCFVVVVKESGTLSEVVVNSCGVVVLRCTATRFLVPEMSC